MSDGALDLSLSSYEVNTQRPSRSQDQVSSDSGRASSDSTSSDIHDDIKPRFHSRTSPPRIMTASPSRGALAPPTSGVLPLPDPSSNSSNNTHHLGPRHSPRSSMHFLPSARLHNLPPTLPQQHPHTTTSSSTAPSSSPPRGTTGNSGRLSNPESPEATSSLQEDDIKPLPVSMSTSHSDRGSDPRVAPIRPFKMYPVDAFNVYNSQLMLGSGNGLSPSPVGIQSLYDSGSPSSFPNFPLTPLTSHLLQRKRRAELRDNANSSGKSEPGSPVASVANSSSPSSFGNAGVSSSLPATSQDSDLGMDDDSDPEKRAKIVPDENKDEAYWDRRRKNNEAAKRSRDARRQKEEEIAMRAAFLEQENLKLRAQVAILKNETAKLHYMLYNRI